jgi:hypothetical protein
MHASKSLGVYFSSIKTIGFGHSFGEHKGGLTFVHEYSHYMDNVLGNKEGLYFASDKQGSLANKIATEFGKNMNESKINEDFLKQFTLINVDDKSTEDEVALGKAICEQNNITFIHKRKASRNRGFFALASFLF